jgi:hypothetical protein
MFRVIVTEWLRNELLEKFFLGRAETSSFEKIFTKVFVTTIPK